MSNILKLLDRLEKQSDVYDRPYNIPEAWNYFGYTEFERTRPGEIQVNPVDFYSECIRNNILKLAEKDKNYLPALEASGKCCDDISGTTVYSMLPRMLTAWEHGEKGRIHSGTFLKSLCYLPYLKGMGVDIIYLLPVFETSEMYKKGEKASPYAIKNIYRLDPDLHDPLTGEDKTFIETEFRAFIEACHILNIRVMLDFVFRTFSRDNDLLVEHPEWLYWIKLSSNESFNAPTLESDRQLILVDDDNLHSLYNSSRFTEYKEQFTFPPNVLDKAKWDAVVKKHKEKGENILKLVENEFGITTMPGFSNVLNDPQPPWKDVTYPKFYFDSHKKVVKYIDPSSPDFLMQDGVSLNKYHGSTKNVELWSYIEGVIPYYQQNYGIDGARIDMGHALPAELNKSIIRKAKENNSNFLLWSEEFLVEKSAQASRDGFHFISGFLYGMYKEIQEMDFNKKLFEDTLLLSELPVAAAMETPDTPRSAYIHNKSLLEIITFINGFIPNKVLFINNGQELMEYQPMNLGLDNTEAGRFILKKTDPMYGKLAFFDSYYLKWTSEDRKWIEGIINKVNTLNKEYKALVSRKDNFYLIPDFNRSLVTAIMYFDSSTGQNFILLVNRSLEKKVAILIKDILPEAISRELGTSRVKYSNANRTEIDIYKEIWLSEGEIIAVEVDLNNYGKNT